MKIFFITSIFNLNLMFCMMKHPLSLGLIILTQTILMSLTLGLMSKTFWYSYIIFLIMVGALLILFIYMTSLIPNKKFKFSKIILIMPIYSLLILFLSGFYKNYLISLMKINSKDMNNSMINLNNLNDCTEYYVWIFEEMNYSLTLSLMIYLLLVLIIIVYIINVKKGTMRKLI